MMSETDRSEKLDELVEQLQSTIDEEEALVFSEKTLAEARHPTNLGPMEEANASARRTGTCGDTMEFFLKVEGDRLAEVTFVTDGCGATVACGSMLTKMAKGRTLDEVMAFRDADLLDSLDGLPEENLHCARLAVGTLQGAVHTAME
jgi:nitrogen fixation NifU-like protein